MFARSVAAIGTGYVGPTTGACLASIGHRVLHDLPANLPATS